MPSSTLVRSFSMLLPPLGIIAGRCYRATEGNQTWRLPPGAVVRHGAAQLERAEGGCLPRKAVVEDREGLPGIDGRGARAEADIYFRTVESLLHVLRRAQSGSEHRCRIDLDGVVVDRRAG